MSPLSVLPTAHLSTLTKQCIHTQIWCIVILAWPGNESGVAAAEAEEAAAGSGSLCRQPATAHPPGDPPGAESPAVRAGLTVSQACIASRAGGLACMQLKCMSANSQTLVCVLGRQSCALWQIELQAWSKLCAAGKQQW